MSDFKQAKWMIIINPVAANGKVAKIWPQLERRLSERLSDFSLLETQYPGHGTQLAETAVIDGYRHIIAVGGDGTNHEVTNGILQQKVVPSQDIYYALFPVGTGNDWSRFYEIPHQLENWLDMLEASRCFLQEVGLVQYWENDQQKQRYFVNVAGMAYDAFVVHFGAQHRRWVRNRFFYLLLILRCLFKYRLSPGIVEADQRVINQRFYTINIGICRYSGGGMQLVPQAVPDDGLLALTYAGPVSKLGVLLNTWRFYNGSIGRHPKIQTEQARRIRVDVPFGGVPLPLEADGEFLGFSPAVFSLKEGALRVIIP